MDKLSTPTGLRDLAALSDSFPKTPRLPVLFVGHGSPMNAIEDNAFSRTWEERGNLLPVPSAIVVISAHWLTHGTLIGAMPKPRTIHDFGGFPQELFAMQYPAPGSPELAEFVNGQLAEIKLDHEWGLDHGAWSILSRMFPKANIPVLQLSIDWDRDPGEQYRIAGQLRELRQRGVLFLGSGNIVHNLREVIFDEDVKFDWALEFEALSLKLISEHRYQELIDWKNLGAAARRSIPTDDHYRPFLATLGLTYPEEEPRFFNRGVNMGSLSMLSVQFGD